VSGLLEVRHILKDVPGIVFHTFTAGDVVRHPLVQRIVEAYDRYKHPAAGANRRPGS
jgi:phosphate starvation-inducible PhoH-like protein